MKKNIVERNIKRRLATLERRRGKLSKKQILKTKVSTIDPWMRVAINIVGSISILYAVTNEHSIPAYIFGAIMLLFGIFGNKQSVETIVDQLCTQGVDLTLDAILASLLD